MKRINLSERLDSFKDHWKPKIVGQVNDYQVKLVKIKGDFVWHSHPDTDELFLVLKGDMVVDFRDLDYISSAGLRVILKATKAIKREDGRIMLCSMQDYVKEVFEIAGFDSFLPIVATMDDALKSF